MVETLKDVLSKKEMELNTTLPILAASVKDILDSLAE
jgi:hypothetical protein